MSIEEIEKELSRQSDEVLHLLQGLNEQYLKATLAGPGMAEDARALKATVAENEERKKEVEHRLKVVRDMARERRGTRSDAPHDSEDEDSPRHKLAVAQSELATAQQATEFYKNMQQFAGAINAAAAESAEIGGADVSVTFELAKQQAEAGKWDQANESLVNAHRKAKLVLKRKPFLMAKMAHEPKIKASGKIKQKNPKTNESYGEEVDAWWKEIPRSGQAR